MIWKYSRIAENGSCDNAAMRETSLEPLIINFFQELPTLTINVHIVHTSGHIRAAFSPCLAMVIRHVPCHCHSVATRHTISIIQSHGYIIYTWTSASHASLQLPFSVINYTSAGIRLLFKYSSSFSFVVSYFSATHKLD